MKHAKGLRYNKHPFIDRQIYKNYKRVACFSVSIFLTHYFDFKNTDTQRILRSMVSGQLPEWTQSRMDTIPSGHNPKWTPSRINIIPNEHNPE